MLKNKLLSIFLFAVLFTVIGLFRIKTVNSCDNSLSVINCVERTYRGFPIPVSESIIFLPVFTYIAGFIVNLPVYFIGLYLIILFYSKFFVKLKK